MVRKLTLTLFCFCCSFFLWAQSEEINHQKYWWLRKRLKETFLHVGDKPGESLPGGRLYPKGKYWVMGFGDCTKIKK